MCRKECRRRIAGWQRSQMGWCYGGWRLSLRWGRRGSGFPLLFGSLPVSLICFPADSGESNRIGGGWFLVGFPIFVFWNLLFELSNGLSSQSKQKDWGSEYQVHKQRRAWWRQVQQSTTSVRSQQRLIEQSSHTQLILYLQLQKCNREIKVIMKDVDDETQQQFFLVSSFFVRW